MRRPTLPLTAALAAFGLLFGDTHRTFTLALPAAFVLFALLKAFIDTDTVPLVFKTILLTLLLWLPVCALFLYLLAPFRGAGDCVITFADGEPEAIKVIDAGTQLVAPFEYVVDHRTVGDTDCSCTGRCDGFSVGKPKTAVDAGVLNDKAISKPQPVYPLMAKSACVKGTVTVCVVVSAITGRVIWAQAVSGHPLLRQSARDAACQARFHPTLYTGPEINVSGVLTYNYGR